MRNRKRTITRKIIRAARLVLPWLLTAVILIPVAGILAFSGLRRDAWEHLTDPRRFTVSRGGDVEVMAWEMPRPLPADINGPEDRIAAVAISEDGRELVFARDTGRGSDLYVSWRSLEGWSAPAPLNLVNTAYDETDPHITADGRFLLFASDRPDGSGGYDIWVSRRGDDSWTAAGNLGPRVNSEFHEQSPALFPGENTLYFASDRPVGSVTTGQRRRYWEDLVEGKIGRDYNFFLVEDVILTGRRNPLRDPAYRKDIITHLGGSPDTERAVRAALTRLAAWQKPDGHWDIAAHGGARGHDTAATALSVLACYGWGARHDREGAFCNTARKGLDWLLKQCRRRKGNFARRINQGMYDQALAVIALAEAYAITGDERIRDPLADAVAVIVRSQHPREGGWRYEPRPVRGDMSVTGWQIMALHSASVAGIDVPDRVFRLAGRWLDRVSTGDDGGLYGYQGPGKTPAMTAEAMFSRQVLGADPGQPRQRESARFLTTDRNLPDTRAATNFYYWYYGFLALYQHQGSRWEKWNEAASRVLVERQYGDGTWKPRRWKECGEVVATALGALCLEVYYRYLPMYDIGSGKKMAMARVVDRNLEIVERPKPVRTAPPVYLSIPLNARPVDAVNSPGRERGITFSSDARAAFFGSDRLGGEGDRDIHRSPVISGILQVPDSVITTLNTPAGDFSPALCREGFEMFFCSDRDGRPMVYHTRLAPLSGMQRALTTIGRIFWWLLALLAGLITLVAMLLWWYRARDRKQVGLLMRCLAGSLAAHAVILVLLSLWMIGATIREPEKKQVDIMLDTEALASEKLSTHIREQVAEIDSAPEMEQLEAVGSPKVTTDAEFHESTAAAAAAPDIRKIELAPDTTRRKSDRPERPTAEPPVSRLEKLSFNLVMQMERRPEPVKPAAPQPEDEPAPEIEPPRIEPQETVAAAPPRKPAFAARPDAAAPEKSTLRTKSAIWERRTEKPEVSPARLASLDSLKLAFDTPAAAADRSPGPAPSRAPAVETDARIAAAAPPSVRITGRPAGPSRGAAAADTADTAEDTAGMKIAARGPARRPSEDLPARPAPENPAAFTGIRVDTGALDLPRPVRGKKNISGGAPGIVSRPDLKPVGTDISPGDAPVAASAAPAAETGADTTDGGGPPAPVTPASAAGRGRRRIASAAPPPARLPGTGMYLRFDMEGPSAYDHRGEGDRAGALARFGGGKETEGSIARGLNWLSNHQELDGRWSSGNNGGDDGHDIAVTGLALLCYFGWDVTHRKDGPYRENVQRAVEWLAAAAADGNLTGTARRGMYDQGIATIALAECYALTGDPDLVEPLKKAVRVILDAQHRRLGGWRYQRDSDDCDMSVAGWEIMALTSARMAGIRVPEQTTTLSRRWLERVSLGDRGGKFRYQANLLYRASRTMTAEGMFCRQLTGTPAGDPRMDESARFILAEMPRPSAVNYYYWYYGTLALFQHGGEAWEKWNRQMKKTLLEIQETAGKNAGSWPTDSAYGPNGGRVMTTTLSILSLEVYYRYLPMYSRKKQ